MSIHIYIHTSLSLYIYIYIYTCTYVYITKIVRAKILRVKIMKTLRSTDKLDGALRKHTLYIQDPL